MKKYTNISDLLKDMKKNLINPGETIILDEGKEKGMSAAAMMISLYAEDGDGE